MKHRIALLLVVIGAGLWLVGCDATDPGTPLANRAPETALTMAPLENTTVNHYVPLRWAGNDPDGEVATYNLYIDGTLVGTTTATDTFIAFAATSDGVPQAHTFAVQAVDNQGAGDPDRGQSTRTFSVINFRPTASFDPTGSIAEGAIVGQGFRVTVAAQDSNPSLLYYSIALDDPNAWTPWSADPVFIFADPGVIADTTIFPDQVVGIPNTGLTPGPHTLYVRVKDAGEAISDIDTLTFTVQEGFRPFVNPLATGQYGSNSFYPDGSVYYSTASGVTTSIVFDASAEAYGGELIAFRNRIYTEGTTPGPEEGWTPWRGDAAIDTTDLPPGNYMFEFQARDLAGATSDPASFVVRLVEQVLSDSLIVIDETRSGTGSPGSPSDPQADAFYAAMVAGFKARSIDYDSNRIGDPPVSYISPFDIHNAGVLVWHSDDRTAVLWNNNTRLLSDFLNQGGRLLLSGWDLMGPLGFVQGDSAQYSEGSFARNKLRVFSAARNTARTALGYDGVNGFPSVYIDPAKVPTSWNGRLDYTWTFRQRGEATVVGLLAVSDSTTNPLWHRTASHLYDQSFRVAVFGIPLYFTQQAQAYDLLNRGGDPLAVIPRLLAGLGPVY